MKNAVTWFELGAAPGAGVAMKEFYAKTFGWTYTEPGGPDYSITGDGEAPGISGGLFEDPAGSGTVIYVEVDGIQEYVDRAVANGAELVQEVVSIPGMATYAKVRDPGGNIVGILDSVTPPA